MKPSRRYVGLTAVTLAGLLAVAGCSSSSTASSSAAGPTADLIGGVDVGAELAAFGALDPAAQDSEVRRLSADVDRQLIAMSGLETEIGGPEQAAAAYAQVSQDLETAVRAWTTQPDFGRFGAHVPTADTPSAGGMIAVNLILVAMGAEAAVVATNDLKGDKPASETTTQPDGKDGEKQPGSMTISGSAGSAGLEAGTEITANGVTGKINTAVTVAPCPDVNGQFTATTKMTSSISKAGANTGSNLTVDVAVTGQVDDDAQLVGYELEVNTQSAQFESGKGQFVDISVSWNDTAGTSGGYKGQVNRTGGKVTDEFAEAQVRMGVLMAVVAKDKALEAAKKGWESGRCVRLEPTTSPEKRKDLKPSTSVTITAAPRSKIDGGAVGGTVTATLSGDTSVEPSGSKVKADAKFTYVAPGEKDKSASVALEARSKRGVAKADVVFDTKPGGYVASGGGSGIVVSGSVPDLSAPFTLTGTGTGFTVTFDYTPTAPDGRSGTLRYSGKGGGVTLKGTGDYTIAGDDGEVLTMTSNNQGCATPGGCRSHVETITLTPTT
jgi:hypothetical protein